MSDLSDLLYASYFPSSFVFGIDEVAFSQSLQKIVVFKFIGILSHHVSFLFYLANKDI